MELLFPPEDFDSRKYLLIYDFLINPTVKRTAVTA